jgi:hypothetical protein
VRSFKPQLLQILETLNNKYIQCTHYKYQLLDNPLLVTKGGILPILQPYPCQKEVYKAILESDEQYVYVCTNRRWGKDLHAFQMAIIQASMTVCNVAYFLPKYKQASLVILSGKTAKGVKYTDLIPKKILSTINNTTRVIHFKNGSQIFLVGTDNYDKLRGIGAKLFVISEAAFSDLSIIPNLILPILDESDGKLLAISTASFNDHKFHRTIRKIKEGKLKAKYIECTVDNYLDHNNERVITDKKLARTREHSTEATVMREYYCNPSAALENAFFNKQMAKLIKDNRLKEVKSQFKDCYAAFDLGSNTSIIIFNMRNNHLFILDNLNYKECVLEDIMKLLTQYLEVNNLSLIALILPHDAKHFNKTGFSVMNEIKEKYFFSFQILDISKSVLIELQRMALDFEYLYIDKNAEDLLEAMGLYELEHIEEQGIIKEKPKESFVSHRVDALRYAFNYYWLINTRKNFRILPSKYDRE